jgi:hypothetical protein
VTIRLEHSRIYAADCADCETREGMLDRIDSAISLTGPLEEAQRARLLEIAARCPVHRTLTSEIDVRARLADPARERSSRGAPPASRGGRDDRSSPPASRSTRQSPDSDRGGADRRPRR